MRGLLLAAFLSLAACSSAPAPVAMQPAGVRGQATDYSVASREDRAQFSGMVPATIAASAIRIGNDGCYYYVNGPVMSPLVSPSNTAAQICR